MNEGQQEIANQILKDLGLENLKDPTRSKLIETIQSRIAQKTMLCLMENIPESELPALEKAIEEKGEEAAITEMSERIPDLKDKLTEALANLYQELVSDAKKIVDQTNQAV